MSKVYVLASLRTLSTAFGLFNADRQYSQDEVAKVIDATDENGEPYFVEVESESDTPVKEQVATRKIKVNKATSKQTTAEAEQLPEELTPEGASQEGEDETAVTV